MGARRMLLAVAQLGTGADGWSPRYCWNSNAVFLTVTFTINRMKFLRGAQTHLGGITQIIRNDLGVVERNKRATRPISKWCVSSVLCIDGFAPYMQGTLPRG